ncbi:MAG: hypothetical protein HYY46_11925 [Deltaproteobacteria bacterium]|nr:hypothetical protein [Deltaproteobacteria bacterium]
MRPRDVFPILDLDALKIAIQSSIRRQVSEFMGRLVDDTSSPSKGGDFVLTLKEGPSLRGARPDEVVLTIKDSPPSFSELASRSVRWARLRDEAKPGAAPASGTNRAGSRTG